MGTKFSCILLDITVRAAIFGSRPLSFIPSLSSFRQRKGQSTVEYLLMLAVVVGLTIIVGALFHKRILGGMFSLVGMVIGAGKPAAP